VSAMTVLTRADGRRRDGRGAGGRRDVSASTSGYRQPEVKT
jgi:hypothetical protein